MLQQTSIIREFNKSAFSIIESMIAVVVVSMLTVFLMDATNLYYTISGMRITEDRMAKINDALLSYAKINGHLPCPASLEALSKDVSFGKSVNCSSVSSGNGIIVSGKNEKKIVHGTIPIKELGLPRSYMYDKWHRRLAYVVIANLAIDKKSFTTYSIKSGDAPVLEIKNIQGKIVSASGMEQPAYLLISYGKSGMGAHNSKGKIINACDTTFLESENCTHSNIFLYSSSVRQGLKDNYFDDILSWLSYSAILNAYKTMSTSSSITKNVSNPEQINLVVDYYIAGDTSVKNLVKNVNTGVNPAEIKTPGYFCVVEDCQNSDMSALMTEKSTTKSCLVYVEKNIVALVRSMQNKEIFIAPDIGYLKVDGNQIKLILNPGILHKAQGIITTYGLTIKTLMMKPLSAQYRDKGLYIISHSIGLGSLGITDNDVVYIDHEMIIPVVSNFKSTYPIMTSVIDDTRFFLEYTKSSSWNMFHKY
ncbi:hypothetical protein CAXC1_70063 [Candidatus Xenohaliotis californiensis]|uniref:Uncharacterized protein n=1 Tax=Candidatus Xenohaliotis californiensis TaxID=84677 RepID=A0ABP0EU48_9RICK|nr:hypothetical protein CAXC1_70063 [Candidatus Xenohaliotis californiensis]